MPRGNSIGATGFEPAASWSQTKRSTKLSYAPSRLSSLAQLSIVGRALSRRGSRRRRPETTDARHVDDGRRSPGPGMDLPRRAGCRQPLQSNEQNAGRFTVQIHPLRRVAVRFNVERIVAPIGERDGRAGLQQDDVDIPRIGISVLGREAQRPVRKLRAGLVVYRANLHLTLLPAMHRLRRGLRPRAGNMFRISRKGWRTGCRCRLGRATGRRGGSLRYCTSAARNIDNEEREESAIFDPHDREVETKRRCYVGDGTPDRRKNGTWGRQATPAPVSSDCTIRPTPAGAASRRARTAPPY
jgi:hypothetical protein